MPAKQISQEPSIQRRLIQQAARDTPEGVEADDGRTQAERAVAHGISVRTQGKLDFLWRERPDLLRQVAEGEMSAHEAYLTARGDQSPRRSSPVTGLKRLWNQASTNERLAIANWILSRSDLNLEDDDP